MTTYCGNCKHPFDEVPGIGIDQSTPCPNCGSISKDVIVSSSPAIAISMPSSSTVKMKSAFSLHHLLSAALFARSSYDLETNLKTSITEEITTEHRAYVTSSVLTAVAALEAGINEFYLESLDQGSSIQNILDNSITATLQELWPTVEEMPILKKYQIALITTKKNRFEKGEQPFQDAESLIKLRNALVHFRPEWDTDLQEHKKLEDRLRSKFALNPYAAPNQVFFPYKCLGHGCAEWAVNISKNFMGEFYVRIGKLEHFKPYSSRLGTR